MSKTSDPVVSAIVASNLQRLRLARGWDRKELARRAGWGERSPMVYQLEDQRTGLSLRTLRKLGEALEVDLSEFFRGNAVSGLEGILPRKWSLFSLSGLLKWRDTASVEELGQILASASVPLPGWVTECQEEIISAVIGDEKVVPPVSRGDIVGINIERRNVTEQPLYLYVVRLETEIRIARLSREGQIVTLHGAEEGETPILIDLRAYPSAIIGHVTWVVKSL